jgi:disulfide bond formation protein DsbB
MKIVALEEKLNILGLTGIIFASLMAFVFQIYYHELPCPLCLLQRFAILCAGYGFLLNLRFGFHRKHYGLSLMGAILANLFSTRQILLHIVPGTGSYGSPLFGLHLYTWVRIFAVAWIIYIAFIFLLNHRFELRTKIRSNVLNLSNLSVCYGLLMLTFINVVSTLLECEFGSCPDDPVSYLL